MQPERDLRDHAERAFRSDEQPREVVAGRRFARPRAGTNDLAAGQDHRQPEHVVAHGAVAHGGRAGGARGGHAANRRVGARIDREHQARVSERLAELQSRDAGFNRRVQVLGADAQDAIELAQVDRDAAFHGVHVAFERRPGAERDDRDLKAMTDAHDLGDFFSRPGKAHDVRRGRRVVGLAVAVVFAHGGAVVGTRAEQLFQCRNKRHRVIEQLVIG